MLFCPSAHTLRFDPKNVRKFTATGEQGNDCQSTHIVQGKAEAGR